MTGRPAETVLLLAALCAVGCGPSESAVRPVSGIVFEDQPRRGLACPALVIRGAAAQLHRHTCRWPGHNNRE